METPQHGIGPKTRGNGPKKRGNRSKKKRKILLKIVFEGFPIIFEKTGNASKNSFWGGFLFWVRFRVEAFP